MGKLVYFKMYLKARDTGFRRNLNKETLAGGVLIRYFSINKTNGEIHYDVFCNKTG